MTGNSSVERVGWKGVTDPELRQRVEAVRIRSEQRIKDRAAASGGSAVTGRYITAGGQPSRGRWIVVRGKTVRETT